MLGLVVKLKSMVTGADLYGRYITNLKQGTDGHLKH